jgi:hypothetical protein
MELGFVFGSCSSRNGRTFAARWPGAHPSVRPLELVFEGLHAEHGVLATRGAVRDDSKNGLLDELAAKPRVRELMQAIEASCTDGLGGSEATAQMDVLAGIVDLLPVELLGDPDSAASAVERVLAQIGDNVIRVLQDEGSVSNAEITRTAVNVAKKYFVQTNQPVAPALPVTVLAAGRPEDEAITADLDQLLEELAQLPADPGLRLPTSTAISSSPELAAELLGIYLQVLIQTERPSTLRALAVCLPKALEHADESRFQVLDFYLQSAGSGAQAALTDDRRLELLGILERSAHAGLVCARGYVDGGLVARTFPASLPLMARLLDSEPGRLILADGLRQIGPQRLLSGSDVLRAKGLLAEPALLAAIPLIGSELVLPIIRRLATIETPAAKAVVVGYLRQLPLPPCESAALRHVEPATELTGRYLEQLTRMVADSTPSDPRAQQASGQLLRRYVTKQFAGAPHKRQLELIRMLADVPDNETVLTLHQLSRPGRSLMRFTRRARALRKQVLEVLRQLSQEPSSS